MYTTNKYAVSPLFKSYFKEFFWYPIYVTAVYIAYEKFGLVVLDIKMAIATVLSFAVSILVGFRTSESYDRWWEARKIWGGIVNDSRSLIRQMIAFTGGVTILEETKQMTKYQIAWCYALKNSLRKLDPLSEIHAYLSQEEIALLKTKHNKPNEILKMMGNLLRSLHEQKKIDSFQMVAMDETVKHLCDHMGKSERINNTVFPTQYTTYTHIGIIFFMMMLPFGMLSSTGPFVILICLLVSLFFFMLEAIAFYLQDPFTNRPSDIPMTALCRTIEINLLEMIDAAQVPEPIQPDEKGVLM